VSRASDRAPLIAGTSDYKSCANVTASSNSGKPPSPRSLEHARSEAKYGIRRSPMAHEVIRQSKAVPAASVLALALGAAAFGAMAVGALAVGRIAVGRLAIKKARLGALEVDELTVRKLRVVERDEPSA
jgi:hypothetical protein